VESLEGALVAQRDLLVGADQDRARGVASAERLVLLVVAEVVGAVEGGAGEGDPRWLRGGGVAQRNESAVTRLTSVTASAGIPARRAAAMIASALGASYRQ
jgi:hypothetical protein